MSDTTGTPPAPEEQGEVTGSDAPQTLGERLLPVLVIALESCLLYALLLALAGFSFLQSSSPVLPIWLMFGVSLGIYWLTQYLARGEAAGKSGRLFALRTYIPHIVVPLLAVGLTWLLLSSQAGQVFALPSLATLLNAVQEFPPSFYQALGLFALISFVGWRGVYRARTGIEPQTIKHLFRLGLGCFFLVLLCYLVQGLLGLSNQNTAAFFLLIPTFLLLALLSQSLYQVSYLRRFHAIGLHGSARQQERVILQGIGVLAIVVGALVLAIGNASFAFSERAVAFFAPVGALFNWLANGLTQLLVLIWTPIGNFIIWLFNLLPYHKSPPPGKPLSCDQLRKIGQKYHIKVNLPPNCLPFHPHPQPAPNYLLLNILKVVLMVLFASVVLFVLWRKYRKVMAERARTQQGEGDVHENIWSWALFLGQLRAFFTRWLAFLAPWRKKAGTVQSMDDIGLATPSARTIRAIYRAFLKRAARKGYPRAKDETAYEFRQRLDARETPVEPELEALTEAYTLIRYGGGVPDEQAVATARQTWRVLEHKW